MIMYTQKLLLLYSQCVVLGDPVDRKLYYTYGRHDESVHLFTATG